MPTAVAGAAGSTGAPKRVLSSAYPTQTRQKPMLNSSDTYWCRSLPTSLSNVRPII